MCISFSYLAKGLRYILLPLSCVNLNLPSSAVVRCMTGLLGFYTDPSVYTHKDIKWLANEDSLAPPICSVPSLTTTTRTKHM